MNYPLAPYINEEGPYYLNSQRWSHVNRLIGWRHRKGVSEPLTSQALGKDRLHHY